MRLLMLSHGYPPAISGVTLIVQKFSRLLVEAGIDVTVITASDRGRAYRNEDHGVELIRLRSFRNPIWREARIPYITAPNLGDLIAGVSPQLIHTHENTILSTQLLKLRDRFRVPFISSAYSVPEFMSSYLNTGELVTNLIKKKVWRFLINNLNQYDHVIFSNPTLREIYIDKGLSARISIISNGVDTTRYHPNPDGKDAISDRYDLPPRPRILHVGRLARDKQIEILIEAMPEIHQQCSAHLLIVGRGDHRSALEQLVQSLDLDKCVHLLGYIPEVDLPAIYRAVDIFTVVSRSETQSLPALQALATGLPVVLVDAACLPELVKPGINGYLVPPNNPSALSEAIIQILSDRKKRHCFGAASLEIVEPHAINRSIRELIDLYENMINTL